MASKCCGQIAVENVLPLNLQDCRGNPITKLIRNTKTLSDVNSNLLLTAIERPNLFSLTLEFLNQLILLKDLMLVAHLANHLLESFLSYGATIL